MFQRILLFIPTLFAITLMAFIINAYAPGDPVDRMVNAAQGEGAQSIMSTNLEEQKQLWRKKLGLDLPLFYISIASLAEPDTLYKIHDKRERKARLRLIREYGNYEYINSYFQALADLEECITAEQPERLKEQSSVLSELAFQTRTLSVSWNDEVIGKKLEKITDLATPDMALPLIQEKLHKTISSYREMKQNPSTWKNYIPVLHFFADNQYDRWLFGDGNRITGKGALYSRGIVRGDFGLSYITRQPVSDILGDRLFWSVLIVSISMFLAYLLSIPLGVNAAVQRNRAFDRLSGMVLFLLYSMPSFWVAVLLLMIFSNPSNFPDYEAWLPASGVKPASGYPAEAGIWEKISITGPYLVLPVLCFTYGSLAFLSRTMRASMLEIFGHDYIRTAKAKGLKEVKVIWKHSFKNALLPMVTLFSNVFPMAIGGSVIIESIFNIPGMGNEIFTAIHNRDYPVIVSVFTLTGLLTMIGFLIADVAYAIIDPRIDIEIDKKHKP